eukprot:scaffold197448_cov31-Prasinocladus_malaysianus.AAC.1
MARPSEQLNATYLKRSSERLMITEINQLVTVILGSHHAAPAPSLKLLHPAYACMHARRKSEACALRLDLREER